MRAFGNITTAATTEAAVDATAYVEQTANGGRSFKSSSASDAAAGTGARSIKLTYLSLAADGSMVRNHETLVLNGVTAVPTVNLDIACVEKIEVVTVGSGGVPVGAISMYDDVAGAGGVMASIAAGKLRTFYAHHYVASGQRCKLTGLSILGGNATAASFQVRSQPFPKANIPEQPLMGPLAASNAASIQQALNEIDMVPGPAKITTYVTPGNNTSQVSYADLSFDDI